MPEKPLEKVVKCFIDDDFPHGLTAKKIYDRAKLVEDEERPDQIVFEMERHQPILGETHQKGVPMVNYATYQCRYVFDLKEETLGEISKDLVDMQIDVWKTVDEIMSGDSVSFKIEEKDDGFHVKEIVSTESGIFDSKDDFIRWARKIVENWYLDYYLEGDVEKYLGDQLEDFKKSVIEGCKDRAEERAKRDWKRCMASEE